jgi:hypothetical protein
VGFLEVLGVLGDDVVSPSSFRAFIDTVVIVVSRDFQPMPRVDSDADRFQ